MATMTGTEEALKRRVGLLRERLDAEGLDAFIATSKPAYTYLTGFRGDGYERLIAAVITRTDTTLLLPALEEEAAVEQSAGVVIQPWHDGEDAISALCELAQTTASMPQLGVEEKTLTLEQADRITTDVSASALAHAGKLIADLRLRKDDAEIDAVRQAGALLRDAFERAFAGATVGMSEIEIQAKVELDIKAQGGGETISLVQIGERAALPHGATSERSLATGDVLLIDAATTIGGYWGDITRCATVGPPSKEVRAAWDAVRAGYEAGLAAVGPGARACDVDRAARAVIETAGYGAQFIHRTGHGLGLEVHEPPYLSGTSIEVLEPGMIVTVEPGVYLPGMFGLRLENDVLVTDTGAEVLTDTPEQLLEL